MELLILGGTAWLGREIAEQAVARGHAVTCLARGASGPRVGGARFVVGDRDHRRAYESVVGQTWDAVIDVARQPGHVRRAVDALHPVAARYLFVSSANVYAGQREVNQDEDAGLLRPLTSDVMESMAEYGEAKTACEQAVLSRFEDGRAMVARVGLIGGPGDLSGRTGYWPWRFAHPSNDAREVLVPDDPLVLTAVIDVRDLAAWMVVSSELGTTGVFNAAGDTRPLADHLAIAGAVAAYTGPSIPASPGWLREQGVNPWTGPTSLPLWLDDPGWYGMNARNTDRARAAGLVIRPLRDTLADALVWEDGRPNPGVHGAGLTDEEERGLLARLASSRRWI